MEERTLGVRMPKRLFDALQEYVKNNTYFSKSEFVRELIRRELQNNGFINVQKEREVGNEKRKPTQ